MINRRNTWRALAVATIAVGGLLIADSVPANAQSSRHWDNRGHGNRWDRDQDRIRRERERERERIQWEGERERERRERERRRDMDRRGNNRDWGRDRGRDRDWRDDHHRHDRNCGCRDQGWGGSNLPDVDRDGIPDNRDPDIDGDGIDNEYDRDPYGYNRRW